MDATESVTRPVDAPPHATAPPIVPAQAAVPRVPRLAAIRVRRPALQGLLAFAIYLAVFIVCVRASAD